MNYVSGTNRVDSSYLSDFAFDNYDWPLLVIMGGFFATVLGGLFTKNTHAERER